jgi:uncharacterized protein (TIGR02466 family)
MKDPEIIGIFPTPIYFSKLNRKFTSKEITFIKKVKINNKKNLGKNKISEDTYVLNNTILKNLKNFLNVKIQDYFDKIVCPANNVKPYITQSWLNFTKENESHHKHNHSNSLVAGVLYINCDEKFDKIKFFNEKYKTIRLEIKNYNLFNSESWWFSVKTGDIILFPPSMMHMVDVKEGSNARISLAFNVFIKGKIGTTENINELIL